MTNEEIVVRIQQGETVFVDRLLEQNRGYIWRVAMRYRELAERNRGLDGEDLLQAARLGMIEAIPEWDAERGSFLTVATLHMKGSIRDALGIRSTKERIENVAPPALLGTPVGEDADGEILQDSIQDEAATDPQEAAGQADMQQIVRQAVGELPETQRAVVQARYLDGWTLTNIAVKEGYSASRAAQIEYAGMRMLRRSKRLRYLWTEYDAAVFSTRAYGWKNTHTSAVEAAAIRRERILEIIAECKAEGGYRA